MSLDMIHSSTLILQSTLFGHPQSIVLDNDSFEVLPPKKVGFNMYSCCFEDQNKCAIVRTKEYDGTINEHKRCLSKFINLYLNKKLNISNASDEIEKLIGRGDDLSKLQFIKYCIEQTKIVIKKIYDIEKDKEEDSEDEDSDDDEVEEVEEVEDDEDEDNEFYLKWSHIKYDMAAAKRCVRGVSLIREPSRDMANMKFAFSHIKLLEASLKFLEDVEEIIFMRDFIVV